MGVALVAMGVAGMVSDAETAASWQRLAEEAGPSMAAQGAVASEPVWDKLAGASDECAGWLEVAGTSVDVPVMRAPEEDPDRWLYRALDGTYSETGTPFVDSRCDPGGNVLVVLGHRTLYSSYLFHDLADAFGQEAFDRLGDATWHAREGGVTTYVPLCAASVDMTDARWQRFGFAGLGDLREWLGWCVDNAGATASDADALASGAGRCLVLVTCNGRNFYPTTRTITVFVAEAVTDQEGAPE